MNRLNEVGTAGTEDTSQNNSGNGDANDLSLGDASLQISDSSVVTTQMPAEGTVVEHLEVLPPTGEQCNRLAPIIDEIAKHNGLPTEQELHQYGMTLRGATQEIEFLQARADQSTVEWYFHCGRLIRVVGRRLNDKTKVNAWLTAQITRPSQLEVFRQMVKIASMGPDVLRYSYLGKNRVLELYYLLKGMEELNDGSVNPESFRRRVKEIEQAHPFPAHAAAVQKDVDECKVHMDSIITQDRIERAFGSKDVCSFEDAKAIARSKKNSFERSAAVKLVKHLEKAVDKKAAVKNWIAGGMKFEHAVGAKDPARIAELLGEVNKAIEAVTVSEETLTSLRSNTVVMQAFNAAYTAVNDLHVKLTGVVANTGDAA